MSLWADYISELTSGRITFIEEDWGFISFSFPDHAPDCVFAEDIYIVPGKRDASRAYQLLGRVEQAGLKSGKTHTLFTVRADAANASNNLRMYLAMGFLLVDSSQGTIWLKRQINISEEANG